MATQETPPAQLVGPVQVFPPHCPQSGANSPPGGGVAPEVALSEVVPPVVGGLGAATAGTAAGAGASADALPEELVLATVDAVAFRAVVSWPETVGPALLGLYEEESAAEALLEELFPDDGGSGAETGASAGAGSAATGAAGVPPGAVLAPEPPGHVATGPPGAPLRSCMISKRILNILKFSR